MRGMNVMKSTNAYFSVAYFEWDNYTFNGSMDSRRNCDREKFSSAPNTRTKHS